MINENRHNSEFILTIIIHIIFILLILSGLVRAITRAIFPALIIRFVDASHLYEFDKRDWKYICHVASL